MPKVDDGTMTVKAYAAANHVSRQSVNSKINRHREELKGHVFKVNGRKVIDEFAQNFLKPTKNNILLANKNANLEKSLNIWYNPTFTLKTGKPRIYVVCPFLLSYCKSDTFEIFV